MARRQEVSSNIFILVFSIAFGLLALALGYQAVMNNSDIRSRAAQTEIIYKQWEFNGKDTEGWTVVAPNTGVVKNGTYVVSRVKGLPALQNTNVSTSLPNGLKTVSLFMSVGPVQAPIVSPTETIPSKSSVQPIQRFTATLYYSLAGIQLSEKQVLFSGMADGKFQTYNIKLPDIGPVDISTIRVVFTSGVKIKESVSLDWIRMSGVPLKATPTPKLSTIPTPTCIPRPACMDPLPGEPACSPVEPINGTFCPKMTPTFNPTPSTVCKTGVSSFSVDTPCSGGYQYMTFRCYDGFGRREGGASSCKSSEVWNSYAKQYCAGHSNCPTTPTNPPTPTACGPISCRIPPPGCYYDKPTPCSCGTLICSVPITKTPTPTTYVNIVCAKEDINNDGIVNQTDVNIVYADISNTVPLYPKSDINKDGRVDIFDYNIVMAKVGYTTGSCIP